MNAVLAPQNFVRTLPAWLALVWLAAGCASSSSPPPSASAPKPGRGLAEYREVAQDAHQAVASTVKALEALAQPSRHTSRPHPALSGFDRAVHQLELTSIKARARAEAIIARGEKYFEEWKGNLTTLTNAGVARAETERYEQMRRHFERVRERSGAVREEFRPFMAELRGFRARLDRTLGSTAEETTQHELENVTKRGRRVLQTLDAVSTALNDAEGALRSRPAAAARVELRMVENR